MTPQLRRVVATGLVALVGIGFAAGCSRPARTGSATVDRVLVVTLPGVTWDEVAEADLPALEGFIEESAIGDVSTKLGRVSASTTAAYLTLGSGTRSVVPGVDTGVALNPDESLAGVPATDLLRRRLGRTVDGIAYIPVGAAIDANQQSPFGAEPGLLGDALRDAGVHRAVVANADAAEGFPTDEPPPDGAYSRSAVTALMGRDGVVPGGSVGRSLLVEDRQAPFGRRLDRTEVLAAFDREWDGHQRVVALVEASDLARASAYRPRSTPAQARSLRSEALVEADALLADLLERTDPERDAVLVVAPTAPGSLGVVALRAPGVDAGLLRSPNTRRDGYVYLADVSPTILALLGEPQPTDVEGRRFDVAPTSVDRVEHLRRQSAHAGVRAERLPVVVPVLSVVVAALALSTIARARRGEPVRRAVALTCHGVLGTLAGTFLAGAQPVKDWPAAPYVVLLLASGVGTAALAAALDRHRAGLGVLAGPMILISTITFDVLTGAHLQINTVFGYSMAVAGRYTGLGNLAFSLFASAVLCAAVAAYERWGPRSLPLITAALVFAMLIEGLPMLGADVGGTLAVVPAFGLALSVLHGVRLRWWHVLVWMGMGFVVVGAFGLVDSSQPAEAETHLARLGSNLAEGRLDVVATTLWRRFNASFGSGTTIQWLIGLGVIALALAQASAVRRGVLGPAARLRHRPIGDRALAVGLSVLAGVGLVANDSSVAVPATMLLVVVPFLIIRRAGAAASLDASPADEPRAPRPPAEAAVPA